MRTWKLIIEKDKRPSFYPGETELVIYLKEGEFDYDYDVDHSRHTESENNIFYQSICMAPLWFQRENCEESMKLPIGVSKELIIRNGWILEEEKKTPPRE